MPQPLAELTIVEASGDVATRYCGKLFAEQGARVIQLQAVPARAAIAALVDRPGGAGLVYLDVATGEATDALQADEPARGFSVSADGRRLALTLDGRVVLFDESGGNAAN